MQCAIDGDSVLIADPHSGRQWRCFADGTWQHKEQRNGIWSTVPGTHVDPNVQNRAVRFLQAKLTGIIK